MSLLTAATVLTGCGSTVEDIKITMATGSEGGVYYSLGNGLADIWSGRLGIVRPQVVATAGSKDNVTRLVTNQAQVGFSQADAVEGVEGASKLRALARMHDDYLQVIVRSDLPVTVLSQLSGLRVSIGAKESGVEIIARRMLQSENVRPRRSGHAGHLHPHQRAQHGLKLGLGLGPTPLRDRTRPRCRPRPQHRPAAVDVGAAQGHRPVAVPPAVEPTRRGRRRARGSNPSRAAIAASAASQQAN